MILNYYIFKVQSFYESRCELDVTYMLKGRGLISDEESSDYRVETIKVSWLDR